MGLRDIELTLPPGFRFYPSDEELVCHYLHNKVVNERYAGGGTMVEVDLHTHEPWELPDVAKLSTNEWYFFSFRDRKYATGLRTNRATKSGYWKATGKDRIIHNPIGRAVVGMRKTLVFYRGRAPNGIKSSWVMHEFRMENPHTPPKEDWVLCRVFHKKKAETMEYSVENEQEITSAVLKGCINNNTSHEPDYSPPFPSLNSHYMPASDDFSNMALLHYNSIFDFQSAPAEGGGNGGAVIGAAAAPAGSRDVVLMDLGLEDHYNGLMQM